MRIRIRAALAVVAILGAFVAATAAPASAKPATKAAEECITKLENGGSIDDCQKAPSPLKPENNEIIWGTAAFLVLFLAMLKWGVPAVKNMEKAREDRIRTDLETAEKARTDAETSLAQYRSQIANANAEAQGIIDKARQDADTVRKDLVARAEADAQAIRDKANEDTRLAVDRARVDLNRSVAAMSVELAGKIVERNLDQATQQQLIDSYIASVGSN